MYSDGRMPLLFHLHVLGRITLVSRMNDEGNEQEKEKKMKWFEDLTLKMVDMII